jgi:hypothetical protein
LVAGSEKVKERVAGRLEIVQCFKTTIAMSLHKYFICSYFVL